MKCNKSILFGTLVTLFAACDPATEGFDMGEKYLPIGDIELKATPVAVGDKNSNEIVVENLSPMPSEWTMPQMGTLDKVSTRSCDTLIATHTGENEIRFRTFNALEGTYSETTLKVQVDQITKVPDYIAERLCIGQPGAPTGFSNELDFSKIQVIPERDENGLAGNRVTFVNPNPVMTEWHFGKETSDKNIGELYVLSLGDNAFSATFTLADGTKVEHTFDPVHVETFTFKPAFLVNITGESGSKDWTWKNATASYGLGGYGGEGGWGSAGPDYASMDLGTLSAIGGALGIGDECAEGAKMTFKVTGELIVGSRQGTYSFDLDDVVDGWRTGKLYTKDVTVLYGRQFALDPSNPIGAEIHEYDIRLSTEGELVLCGNLGGGMGTFFCFKSVEKPKKSPFLINLTGDETQKEWTWRNATTSFGLGGYGGNGGWGSQGPDYAQLDLATLAQIGGALGIADECDENARMKFTEDGTLIVGSRQGTYTYDLDDVVAGWRVGKLRTTGVPVLYGRQFSTDPNNPVGAEVYEYDIIKIDEGNLVLCNEMPGDMGTFFCFRAVE